MLVPRRSLIAALFALPAALALPGRLLADTLPEIMPTAKKVGEARFKVFLFKIYDAELFAPDGSFDRKGPYALRLNYLLDAKKARSGRISKKKAPSFISPGPSACPEIPCHAPSVPARHSSAR